MSVLTAPLKAILSIRGVSEPIILSDIQRVFRKDGHWTVEGEKETIYIEGDIMTMIHLTEQR